MSSHTPFVVRKLANLPCITVIEKQDLQLQPNLRRRHSLFATLVALWPK